MEQQIKPKTEAQALFKDLDKPSLHALSYALRHPDTWPEGFVWNYKYCTQCAMGLAHQLWNSIPEANNDNGASIMARRFAMPYKDADSIFLGGKWVPEKKFIEGHLWWKKSVSYGNFDLVTPDLVADQIDAYLANAE